MAPPPDERTRRIAIVLIVVVAVVFLAGLVGLALGRLEVAGLCFVLLAGGWFALRSWQKRRAG